MRVEAGGIKRIVGGASTSVVRLHLSGHRRGVAVAPHEDEEDANLGQVRQEPEERRGGG